MKDKGEQLENIDNVRTRAESRYDDYSSHNVFIFNWVDDYDDQVNSLVTALQHESLENHVRVFNHLTSEELNNEVTRCKLFLTQEIIVSYL